MQFTGLNEARILNKINFPHRLIKKMQIWLKFSNVQVGFDVNVEEAISSLIIRENVVNAAPIVRPAHGVVVKATLMNLINGEFRKSCKIYCTH